MQAPVQTLQNTQRCAITVKMFANDGTEDLTTPVVVQISNGNYMTVTLDPSDPSGRRFIAKATAPTPISGMQVTFTRANGIGDPLVVPFNLTAAPNLSRVELVSVEPLPPG